MSWPLDPKRTALVLIDLQHGVVAMPTQPYSSSSVVEKSGQLAEAFRAKGAPVVFVRVDLANMTPVDADVILRDPSNPPPAIASEIVPEVGKQPGDLVVTKLHWSAFQGTDLEEQLRAMNVDTLVLAGIATNFGVESTVRAAISLGFSVVLVEDATTSINADAHHMVYRLVFPMIARVRTADDIQRALD